ncbi:MAG: HAD-IC family P-type ATPase, partial [Candidatus Bathyarchaeia archaeon]
MSSEVQAYYAMDVDSVMKMLESTAGGLTEAEARDRLIKFGPNQISERKRVTALHIFADQFRDIFVLMLLAAALISAFIGEVVDAMTISAIIILVAVVGFVQDYRGEKALEAMKKMAAATARVLREGREQVVLASEVVPGDILILESGDRIAADARLIETVELKTVEASLTGESTPVDKSTRVVPVSTQVSDRANMVFSGTYVVYGRGKAVVTATGWRTEFGKIAKLIQEAEEAETPLEQKMDRFSKGIAKVVVGLCVVVFILEFLRLEMDESILSALTDAFMTSVSLAISAVPEG